MDKYKKLAANTVLFAVATFSSKLLSFFLMPYVTRKLETGEYGTADLIQQTANLLIPLVFIQISSGVLRFALDKESDKKDVFSVGIQTMALGYLIFIPFAYPLSFITLDNGNFHLGKYLGLVYLFVLTSGTRHLCQHFVRGSGNVKIFAVDGILATVMTLLFTFLFIGVFKWGVYGYILAIIGADACSVAFFFVTNRLWRFIKFRGVNRETRRAMIKYSAPLIPTIILWWIINVSDRFMVAGMIGLSEQGLYAAASKIPNFVMMFATIFMDAWQLSAVDEYDNDETAEFFTKVFRIFSGGVFVVASAIIIFTQLLTKILVAKSYYESWRYVPILIMATTISCFVNFLGSIYMAEKKSIMSMVTALAGAGTNLFLNLILIKLIGANGAAIATVAAFAVVFISRAFNTRKYVKVDFKPPLMLVEFVILVAQCTVMLVFKSGAVMYIVEAVLLAIMVIFNRKPITELVNLILEKFLKRKKA